MASSRVLRSRLVSPVVAHGSSRRRAASVVGKFSGFSWLGKLAIAGGILGFGGLLGCAEDSTVSGRAGSAEQLAPSDLPTGHLGRIHVVLQPRPDELEPEPQLQVHGRFVEYRGVSESLVRARVSLPVPAWEQLVIGQCIATEALLSGTGSLSKGSDERGRELSMIDAGDLRVTLGNRELVAPLALVPDILPWLSGVEYVHVDDRIPQFDVEPDGTSPVSVSIGGSPDGAIEPFTVAVAIPAQLTLEAAKVSDDRLTIDWHPPGGASAIMLLRLQAFVPSGGGVSEPIGDEITCVVADSGRADFALTPLASAGLAADADLLRVSVSRFDVTEIHAGSFGPVEVFIELRAQKTLSLL